MRRLDRIVARLRRETPRPEPVRPVLMNSLKVDDDRIRKDAVMLNRARRYGAVKR